MVQLEKVEAIAPEATEAEAPVIEAEAPVIEAPEAPVIEAPEAPVIEAPTPKRRGRPKAQPKPKPEPQTRGRPKKVPTPPTPRHTPEVRAPIVTHQDFMRYIAIHSQTSKQLQRDHWRNLVRF